jgi:hypothetical protein
MPLKTNERVLYLMSVVVQSKGMTSPDTTGSDDSWRCDPRLTPSGDARHSRVAAVKAPTEAADRREPRA